MLIDMTLIPRLGRLQDHMVIDYDYLRIPRLRLHLILNIIDYDYNHDYNVYNTNLNAILRHVYNRYKHMLQCLHVGL